MNLNVLKVENMPKEIDYIKTMDVFVAFGIIDRIKKVWQAYNKINPLYFCFLLRKCSSQYLDTIMV